MSVIVIHPRDYRGGLEEFKTIMQQKYPNKKVGPAIEACDELCWKVTRRIFLDNPQMPLCAAQAIALEKAIIFFKG